MKSFAKGIAGVLIPILCTWYASGFDNIFITIGVFLLTSAVSLFVFRANIIMIVGMRKYNEDPQKSIKIMRVAYNTGKLKPATQLVYAYLALRGGFIDEAETVISKALVMGKLTLTEQEVKASEFNRAIITWKRGDLASAIVELEELYGEGYKTSGLYGTLGCFYDINKEYEKAVELSKEGIDYSSSDTITRDNLGQAYIGLGMLDEAEGVYDELLAMGPKFMEPYYNYAVIMEKRGKLQEAKEYYEKALTYDEKFLSTITHDEICESLERVKELMI